MAGISKSKAGKAATGGKGAIIGAAAAGLAAGLVANLGRKAAVQSLTMVAGDWMDGLKAEHRITLKVFDAIEKTSEKQKIRRSTLLMQLKHALAKHAFQEENVVYPAMREHGLAEAADALNHDHGYVKQYLYELTELRRDDPAWILKVREFRAALERHVRVEEDVLFPKLHTALGAAGNAQVTTAMNKEGFKIA